MNNPVPDDELVEEWLKTHLTPEKKEELAQMRNDWESFQESFKPVEIDGIKDES